MTARTYTKGQPVIVTIIGVTPVVGTYKRALPVTPKTPKGGHEVIVQGGAVKVSKDPTPYATMDEAMAVVAAFFAAKAI